MRKIFIVSGVIFQIAVEVPVQHFAYCSAAGDSGGTMHQQRKFPIIHKTHDRVRHIFIKQYGIALIFRCFRLVAYIIKGQSE